MQRGSQGAVIPLRAAGPGQSHAGGPVKFDFYIDCLIIYSFFT